MAVFVFPSVVPSGVCLVSVFGVFLLSLKILNTNLAI